MKKYIYLLIALIMTGMMLQAQERTMKINGSKISLKKDFNYTLTPSGENKENIQLKEGSITKATYPMPVELKNTTGETTKYTLHLINPGTQKVSIVRIINRHLGLGSAASKEFVDNAPSLLGENFDFEDVRAFYRELIGAGATAEYESDNPKEVIFFDPRDGYDYRVAKIDGTTWLADNLMFLPAVSGTNNLSETNPQYYVYGYEGDVLADAKATDNYKTYGVLYNRKAALSVCPEGWELPNSENFSDLQTFLGNSVTAYPKLRDYDDRYWASFLPTATNEVGFNALPGGSLETFNNQFFALGYNAAWWTNTSGVDSKSNPYYVGFMLSNEDEEAYFFTTTRPDGAYAVRCIQSKPNITVNTFTDYRDGTEYKYAQLGDDEWMLENVSYLPELHHEDDASSLEPRCYVYGVDTGVPEEGIGSHYHNLYGSLYNKQAAELACPVGWHVPTVAEWEALFDYIGGTENNAFKLKSIEGWQNDGNGEDFYKFNALPGGMNDHGEFSGAGYSGYWWADAEHSAMYFMGYNSNNIEYYDDGLDVGGSLRCVKDKGDEISYRVIVTDFGSISETAFVATLINTAGVEQRDAEKIYAKFPPAIVAKGLDFETARALYRALYDMGADVYYETNDPNGSVFFDGRDGKDYRTVTIENQTWMAENLAYLPSVDSPADYVYDIHDKTFRYYVLNFNGTNVAAAKATDNYKNLGVLYNWYAAENACPQGWRMPTDEDWIALKTNVGGEAVAGGKLKTTTGWKDNGNGTDKYGFSAKPSALFTGLLGFMYINESVVWWCSKQKDEYSQVVHRINAPTPNFPSTYNYFFACVSVRCIKED